MLARHVQLSHGKGWAYVGAKVGIGGLTWAQRWAYVGYYLGLVDV